MSRRRTEDPRAEAEAAGRRLVAAHAVQPRDENVATYLGQIAPYLAHPLDVDELAAWFGRHREAFGPHGEPNYGCTCHAGPLPRGYREHAAAALVEHLTGEANR